MARAAPRATAPAALAAVAVGILFLLRLAALVEPVGVDQGIFATAGWGLHRGLMLYRGVWDQKPPGIHLTYFLGFLLFGAEARAIVILDVIAAAVTCVTVYGTGLRAHSARCGWITALLYAATTFPAARYGYGGFLERAVPECFISPLVAGAALCAVERMRSAEGWSDALMGVLLGLAIVYKPTAALYWTAFLLALWYARAPRLPRAIWRSGLLLCLAPSGVLLWLLSGGAVHDAWIAVVDYNRAYVGTGLGVLGLSNRLGHEVWRLVKTDPLWLIGIASAGMALRVVRRGPETGAPALWVCWLAAALAAIAANGSRFYTTYFIQANAPLAVAGGWFLAGWRPQPAGERARIDPLLRIGVCLLACVVGVRSHYVDRAWRMLRADVGELGSAEPSAAYLDLFGGYGNGRGYSARANAELADYLRAHTAPADRIYIFGMAPSVYFLSQRLPANRFVWTYPGVVNLVGQEAFTVDALTRELAAAAPVYIILEQNNRDSLTGWRIETVYAAPVVQRLLSGYNRETQIEDFTLFKRR